MQFYPTMPFLHQLPLDANACPLHLSQLLYPNNFFLSRLTWSNESTEVPNPRRRSACDCTCVLTRTDHYALFCSILPMNSLLQGFRLSHACHVLFLPMLSSLTSFWRSFTSLVQLTRTFLADFTLSDSTALIGFIAFSRKLHSAFRLDRRTWSQRSHVFRLTGTAALHCGHTFVGGIVTANGQ